MQGIQNLLDISCLLLSVLFWSRESFRSLVAGTSLQRGFPATIPLAAAYQVLTLLYLNKLLLSTSSHIEVRGRYARDAHDRRRTRHVRSIPQLAI